MNRKALLLIVPLLFSCGTNKNTSSVSEHDKSDSSAFALSGIIEIDTFLMSLNKLTDHPNIANVKMQVENNYMYSSGDDYLTVTYTDEFSIQRFLLNGEDGITVREGSYSTDNDSTEYVTQTYHDGVYFYSLTDYQEPSETDIKRTIAYVPAACESNLSINLSHGEEENLRYLAGFKDSETVIYDYELPDAIPENGAFVYSYSLSACESGYLSQKIYHEVAVTVENGIIKSSTQYVENDQFAGTRQKVNYSISRTSISYIQGEYSNFSGTLFDPNNFTELS